MSGVRRAALPRLVALAGFVAFAALNVVITSGVNQIVIYAGMAFTITCSLVAAACLMVVAAGTAWSAIARFTGRQARLRWQQIDVRLAAVLVTLSGVAAASAVVAPLCYLGGRIALGSHPRMTPLAWSPEAAPGYAISFSLGLTWLGFGLWHAYRVIRERRSVWLILFPAFAFGWSGWFASDMSYACNVF